MTVTGVIWETPELSLATYLALELEQDPTIEWNEEGKICSFCFDKTDTLISFVTRFYSQEARVEPREYFLRSSELRKRMNDTRPTKRRRG